MDISIWLKPKGGHFVLLFAVENFCYVFSYALLYLKNPNPTKKNKNILYVATVFYFSSETHCNGWNALLLLYFDGF